MALAGCQATRGTCREGEHLLSSRAVASRPLAIALCTGASPWLQRLTIARPAVARGDRGTVARGDRGSCAKVGASRRLLG